MFTGVFTAIITPFSEGRVDEDALRKFVSWQISNGVHGLVPCGTTGEGATLTDREYANVVKIVVNETKGRVPIIAGAGANSTAKAIDLAKLVIEAGANATLQVTPYYNKPTQDGLFEHFKKIAEEVPAPHILYNVPGRTAVNMLAETTARLSKISNIKGVKEASGDLAQIEKIKGLVPADFAILSGNDDQNLAIYERGGCGAISVASNVMPKETADVWNDFKAGNKKDAEKLQAHLLKLNTALFVVSNPIPVKTACAIMGHCKEEFRLPMTRMPSDLKKGLQEVLKSYQLA